MGGKQTSPTKTSKLIPVSPYYQIDRPHTYRNRVGPVGPTKSTHSGTVSPFAPIGPVEPIPDYMDDNFSFQQKSLRGPIESDRLHAVEPLLPCNPFVPIGPVQPILDYVDEKLCIVCQDSPKAIVLVPCGHFIMCEDCA